MSSPHLHTYLLRCPRPRLLRPTLAGRAGTEPAARVFDVAQYDEVLRCDAEDGGAFRAVTIFRNKAAPSDVVIWFNDTEQYEGLSGGYTFNGTWLRDADGDAIQWRPQPTAPPRESQQWWV